MAADQTQIERLLQSMMQTGEQAGQLAKAVIRNLDRLHSSTEQGNLGNAAATLDSLTKLAAELGELVQSMAQPFPADLAAYLRSGAYQRELHEAAQAAGLTVFEDGDRLLCPPSVVRVLPSEVALDIDGQREHRLRPSSVVATLADRQRRPRFHPAGFLNSLREAYDFVVSRNGSRPDAVVRLIDIWHVFTLLPGRGKEYTKWEFTRDLHLLDGAGLVSTIQSDRELRWCASSGTRSQGMLETIDSYGRQRHYWGIAFIRPAAEQRGTQIAGSQPARREAPEVM